MTGLTGFVGVFGGTFNPIHYGHINPVQHVADSVGLSSVFFVVSARPPHRAAPKVSATHRYRMLSLALVDYPILYADDREIKRPGPSYTLWTLRDLRNEYENYSLCLILGSDVFEKRAQWYRWQEIPSLANIIVMVRPGWELGDTQMLSSSHKLRESKAGIITTVDVPKIPISATLIRDRVGKGADIGDMTPAKVGSYIREHKLYRDN